MSKYADNYEWWIKEHPEMMSWVLDNEGNITIGNVIEALHRHPQSRLAIVEPYFNLFVEQIGKQFPPRLKTLAPNQ